MSEHEYWCRSYQLFLGDSSCDAVCRCESGFSGKACSYTTAQLEENQAMRQQLVETLSSVSTGEAATADSVVSWISSLGAITQNPSEVSSTTAIKVMDVAKSILDGASQVGVSSGVLSSVLSSIDTSVTSATDALSSLPHSRRLQTMQEIHNKTTLLLNSFVAVASNDMVSGQAPVESIHSTFRVGVHAISSSGQSFTAQSSLSTMERVSGVVSSTLTVPPVAEALLSFGVVVSKLKNYGNSSADFYSNPMRVQWIGNVSTASDLGNVEYAIQVLKRPLYGSMSTANATQFTTTCVFGTITNVSHACPSSSSVRWTHLHHL